MAAKINRADVMRDAYKRFRDGRRHPRIGRGKISMNMREKIARAICESNGSNPDGHNYTCIHSGRMICYWERYLPDAGAVLAALADPTPEMVSAAVSAALDVEGVDRGDLTARDLEKGTKVVMAAFIAAIRAATEE